MPIRTLRALALTAGVLVLAACDLLVRPSPIPASAPPMYAGEDAATLHVRVEQSNSYMEGALEVVQLDGPTTAEWAVEGESEARIAPGEYTVIAFEQVCSGNCGFLAAPSNQCSVDLRIGEGQSAELSITFPVPGPCTAEVTGA